MTRQPLKSLARALRPMWPRMLAVMAIMGAGIGMYAGVYSAIDGLFAERDALYRQADVAAYEVRFSPEDSINVPSLQNIPGIRAANLRLLLPGHLEQPNGERISALLVAVETPQMVDRLLMESGQPLDAAHPNRVVIDRNLARHHQLAPGERIELIVGHDRMELEVGGVAVSVEHLVDGADPSFFLPVKGSLGVIFAPLSLIERKLGFRLVNSLLVTGEQVAADLPLAAQKALDERLRPKLTIEEQIPLSRRFGHLFLQTDLNAFRIFTPAIVVVFAASAVTILLFLLYRWVRDQRRELGLLAALGYSRLTQALQVLVPLGWMLMGGIVLGILFAWVMMQGFGREYSHALGLPPPHLKLSGHHIAVGILGLIVAAALAAGLPLRHALTTPPLGALRDDLQRRRLPGVLAAWAAGVKDLVWRHSLRNLLRRPAGSLMTTLSVALALSPALAYFVSLHSFKQSVVESFQRDLWTHAVDFTSPVWDDELDGLRQLPGIEAFSPLVRGAVRFKATSRREPGLVLGMAPDHNLRHPKILEGRNLTTEDRNALLMERRLARTLGLRPGDQVVVEGRLGSFPARVVGLFSGMLPGETFTTREAARLWLDLPEQNTGVLIRAQGADPTDRLRADPRVAKVSRRDALVSEVIHHLGEISGIVYLAAAFSIGVALLFLYTSTALAFANRERDFGLMKLLGYRDQQVVAMVRRELWLLGGAGLLIAIPLGLALSNWLNGMLSEAWFDVPTRLRLLDPLLILVPAALLLPVVARPIVRRILAMDPARLVRERSFG